MTKTRQSGRYSWALLLVFYACTPQFGQLPTASGQGASLPTELFLGNVVDAQGMPPSDPNAPLFRAGTNPLAPLTRRNGDPVTLDDYNDATGQIQIAARPGGGTDVSVDVQGFLPGELYSIWAGYWQDPGFPQGQRIAFGAVTEMGDGSDNFMTADANGAISLDLVQLEGPMTVQGGAPVYAPISPTFDDNGVLQPHEGYTVGVAYHFGDYPEPPFMNPGPIDTWALHVIADFPAVPEPSSTLLTILATAGWAVLGWRERTKLGRTSTAT